MRTPDFLHEILEMLFPPHCALCSSTASSGRMLCDICAKKAVFIHAFQRINTPSCGKTIDCAVPFFYKDLVRESILRFKFYGQKQNAQFYGNAAAEEVRGAFLNRKFDFVTAVPVSRERLRVRGYNQSELIAREAGKQLGVPYQEALEKRKDNREQHLLSRSDRKRNVHGVYRALFPDRLKGKRVLLIDDIVTTGYTLAECADVLFLAGAEDVSCAAVAVVDF